MRDKKSFILTGAVAAMMFVCAVCGKENTAQPEAQESAAEENIVAEVETPTARESFIWSASEKETVKLFGEYYDHYLKLSSDDELRESLQRMILGDGVTGP